MSPRSRRRKSSSRRWPWVVGLLLLLAVAGGVWHQRGQIATPSAAPPAIESPDRPDDRGLRSRPLELPPPADSALPPPPAQERPASPSAAVPPQAQQTLRLIAQGGPFPHRQDGSVFGNREGHLPRQPQGHYREYTVDTPGLNHRGARRIVAGGQPPREFWYTDDHYASFRPITATGTPR